MRHSRARQLRETAKVRLRKGCAEVLVLRPARVAADLLDDQGRHQGVQDVVGPAPHVQNFDDRFVPLAEGLLPQQALERRDDRAQDEDDLEERGLEDFVVRVRDLHYEDQGQDGEGQRQPEPERNRSCHEDVHREESQRNYVFPEVVDDVTLDRMMGVVVHPLQRDVGHEGADSDHPARYKQQVLHAKDPLYEHVVPTLCSKAPSAQDGDRHRPVGEEQRHARVVPVHAPGGGACPVRLCEQQVCQLPTSEEGDPEEPAVCPLHQVVAHVLLVEPLLERLLLVVLPRPPHEAPQGAPLAAPLRLRRVCQLLHDLLELARPRGVSARQLVVGLQHQTAHVLEPPPRCVHVRHVAQGARQQAHLHRARALHRPARRRGARRGHGGEVRLGALRDLLVEPGVAVPQEVSLHAPLALHLDLPAARGAEVGGEALLGGVAKLQLPRKALLHHACRRVDRVAEEPEARELLPDDASDDRAGVHAHPERHGFLLVVVLDVQDVKCHFDQACEDFLVAILMVCRNNANRADVLGAPSLDLRHLSRRTDRVEPEEVLVEEVQEVSRGQPGGYLVEAVHLNE
mmetsp:Transcript_116333/g.290480  ORF Transcript_116333/g.290480 Transcript_116333/m.290480 type:complete len:572 (-) Transcript_116333:1038-2753(-)